MGFYVGQGISPFAEPTGCFVRLLRRGRQLGAAALQSPAWVGPVAWRRMPDPRPLGLN